MVKLVLTSYRSQGIEQTKHKVMASNWGPYKSWTLYEYQGRFFVFVSAIYVHRILKKTCACQSFSKKTFSFFPGTLSKERQRLWSDERHGLCGCGGVYDALVWEYQIILNMKVHHLFELYELYDKPRTLRTFF